LVIAPNLVKKPVIQRPPMVSDALSRIENGESVFNVKHINYVVNELGAYKLKKGISNDYPVIQFIFTDTNDYFVSYVENNVPITKRGVAKDPDLIVRMDQKTAYRIFNSHNIPSAVKEAKDGREFQVELVADMKELAIKGYLNLYESIK